MGDKEVNSTCVIVAGGACDTEKLKSACCNAFVIAADSGLYHCQAAGVEPDLLVGDFDSYSEEIPDLKEIIRLPTHKDDTDLLFAARCGKERGYSEFLIFGGYGSRPDQNFAMLQTLNWLNENVENALAEARCVGFSVYLLKNSAICFKADSERYLSVFAFSGEAYGVNITGAGYPLSNATLTDSFPIGVSNTLDFDTTVSVADGTLLIMTVKKDI